MRITMRNNNTTKIVTGVLVNNGRSSFVKSVCEPKMKITLIRGYVHGIRQKSRHRPRLCLKLFKLSISFILNNIQLN